ncbi:MAG: FMN-binding protein [Candidatus Izemoplasmatales bacterium]
MKNFFKNNSSVLIFSLILILVFVFGGIFSRYITQEKEDFIEDFRSQEEIRIYYESLIELAGKGQTVEVFETEQLTKEYLLPSSETETYQPELNEAYKILADEIEVAVVYVITTHGREAGVKVAYAIDIETKTLIDLKVLSNNETPSFYSNLDDDFFNQLTDKTFDDVVFTIDTVAGATYSSKSFDVGMKYARELFARDFNFEIPNIVYTINSVVRNFDSVTFLTKPYIVNITYGAENNVLEAYFDNEFNYVETITGIEPNQTYKDLFKNDLPATSFIDLKTYITAYDETTRKITIETKGYASKPITVEFELNEALDKVVAMTITTSQTYDEEYNEGYTGAPAPAVENAYKDAYLVDGTYIDAVSSATITSNAMIRIFTLVDDVLTAWNGGGN